MGTPAVRTGPARTPSRAAFACATFGRQRGCCGPAVQRRRAMGDKTIQNLVSLWRPVTTRRHGRRCWTRRHATRQPEDDLETPPRSGPSFVSTYASRMKSARSRGAWLPSARNWVKVATQRRRSAQLSPTTASCYCSMAQKQPKSTPETMCKPLAADVQCPARARQPRGQGKRA